ncbi:efflux RND transporter periplasmic adaptor subunit [Luteimonas sp. e5]
MKKLLFVGLMLGLAACGRDAGERVLPALDDIDTFEIEAGAAAGGRAWDGVVEAVRRADLTAQTAGQVSAVHVDVNDRVQAGQVLLRINAVEQQAAANTVRAQLRAAEAAAAEAEQNYRRFASLAGSQYVSRQQLDQARAGRDAAVASRDAARAQLAQATQQAGYTVVRAPFSGVVARRDAEPGESVAPGMPLISVHAPGELRIQVAVPQTRAEAIRRDPRARVVLGDGREVIPAGVVVFPAADAASHSVNIRVELPELSPAPAPGTTAKVVFDADAAGEAGAEEAGRVRIPASAIARRGELSAAYVLADGRLSMRQLRLGTHQGDEVEVISGLRPGERIARDPVAATRAIAAQREQAKQAQP